MTDTTRKDALQHPMTNVERNALAGALTAIVKRNALAHDNAALQELLAKVGAGMIWGDDWPVMAGMSSYGITIMRAYNGSLDAAQDLHNAVLPEWSWDRSINGTMTLRTSSPFQPGMFDFKNPIPARAWLCAILQALIAECDE